MVATSGAYQYFVVEYDGSIYPCDHFWGEKDYAIEHMDEITIDEASKSSKNFRNNKEFGELENCIRCDWKRICSGGCPGGRIINKKAQYCKSTKQMLTYFVKRIPVLKENELLGKVLNKQIFG